MFYQKIRILYLLMELEHFGKQIYDNHLEERFYITRPAQSQNMSLNRQSIHYLPAKIKDMQIQPMQMQQKRKQCIKYRNKPQSDHIYRTIKSHLYFSKSIVLNPKRKSKIIKSKIDKKIDDLHNSFFQVQKIFQHDEKQKLKNVKDQRKISNKLRIKKQQHSINNHQEIKNRHNFQSFYQQGNCQQNKNAVFSQLYTASLHDKDHLQKILKYNDKTSKHYGQLRQTYIGLVLPASLIQKNTEQNQIVKAQNKKAKTDILYQKVLAKNCEAVLLDIEQYKNSISSQKKIKKKVNFKKRHNGFSIMNKETQSSKSKMNLKYLIQQHDGEDVLNMKQRYLNFQIDCNKDYKSNKNIKEGLKILQRFHRKMDKRMKKEDKRIKRLLNDSYDHKYGGIYDENLDIN